MGMGRLDSKQGEGSLPPLATHLKGRSVMHGLPLSPIIALIAGILILVMPRLLNYIVAVYLIITGLMGLAHLV